MPSEAAATGPHIGAGNSRSPGSAGHEFLSMFLGAGFRPFFLAAGIWATVALALWICILNGQLSLPSRLDPLEWHIHEMLFGFVMATVAGFLLTAISNWTGRPLVEGPLLGGLACLWLLGRIDCLVSDWVPVWLAIAADLSFPAALAGVAAHEIIAARNWRNLMIVAPVVLFGVANLLMHLEAAEVVVSPGLGWRLGLIAALILISVIAGRIVPAFTRNWLVARGIQARLPASPGWPDRAALGTLHTALLVWAFLPDLRPLGFLLIAAAMLNAWRLARWHGAATRAEPLLLILHIGYAWLVGGVALLGIALLVPSFPSSAAIHALTAGAIGTMILAVATRATLGHTGRKLVAGVATVAIYTLVTISALLRIAAAWGDSGATPLLVAAALAWITGFGLFTIVYGRMLLTRRAAS